MKSCMGPLRAHICTGTAQYMRQQLDANREAACCLEVVAAPVTDDVNKQRVRINRSVRCAASIAHYRCTLHSHLQLAHLSDMFTNLSYQDKVSRSDISSMLTAASLFRPARRILCIPPKPLFRKQRRLVKRPAIPSRRSTSPRPLSVTSACISEWHTTEWLPDSAQDRGRTAKGGKGERGRGEAG